MNEQPFFFNENRLFGVIHYPENTSINESFVICHPFMEEKLWAHRVIVSFARRLARAGYTVLRFDYMGYGDSIGVVEDMDITTALSDIKIAIDTIKEKAPSSKKVNLLGLRMGATLASLTADEMDHVGRLVLWEPVVNGSRYMQEYLRSNLATQLAVDGGVTKNRDALVEDMKKGEHVNIEGYDLTYVLYKQCEAIDLSAKKMKFEGKVLLVQIGKNEKAVRRDLNKLSEAYQNVELKSVVEEPFWREGKKFYGNAVNLSDVTCEWLSII